MQASTEDELVILNSVVTRQPPSNRCKGFCKCWRTGVPPTWLVFSALILIQIGFGLYPVVVKKFATEKRANPLIFSFYRDACCFPVLFFCALIAERKILFPNVRMMLVFAAFGLIGMFGNQLLYILGVYWAGPDVTGAFQPITPVWAAILALVLCTEKLPSPLHVHTWVKVIGIVMAAGGAIEITLTAPKDSSDDVTTSHSKRILGYVALLGSTFCSALYLTLQKLFIFNRPNSQWKNYPIYITAYGYFFGAFFMGLASVYYAASEQFTEFLIPLDSAYALVYAIFITSALCFMLTTWTNLHLSTTTITAFWPAQVLIAIVAAYFITQDQLAAFQYIGAVMLIVALVLVLVSNSMEERLRDGKTVLRVDCKVVTATTSYHQHGDGGLVNESSRLLPEMKDSSARRYAVN